MRPRKSTLCCLCALLIFLFFSFDAFGKIKLPAKLTIELVWPKKNNESFKILVSAKSQIPITDGIVSLKIPQIGNEPNKVETLWYGDPNDFADLNLQYIISNDLPVGRYLFVAIFEFTSGGKRSKKMAISRSLYIDVTTKKIFSSNVSFKQLDRLKLKKELEDRVLGEFIEEDPNTLSPALRGLRIAEIRAHDPNIIEERIAAIIASDPNIIRRINDINRMKSEKVPDPNVISTPQKITAGPDDEPIGTPRQPIQLKPTTEEAVPIPEELKKLLKKRSNKVILDENGEPIRKPSPPKGGKPTTEKPVLVPENLEDSK